jgi:hypothetical protein
MNDDPQSTVDDLGEECSSCSEGFPEKECPNSQRPCGHHCNHSLSHDACCWCGAEWGEGGEEIQAERANPAVEEKLVMTLI